MMLAFKSQNCELTLAEGLEIYLDYLKENKKNIGTDATIQNIKCGSVMIAHMSYSVTVLPSKKKL